jgi:dolichol-phosphate mannosyltransferase
MKSVELSIVIPTYNEVKNIIPIVDAIKNSLDDKLQYEIIIVDDNSSDKTWELAENLAFKHNNISCFRRMTAKGLSSAVIDGFIMSKGKFLTVIDADLQHDESKIMTMLNLCRNGKDLVVGSRYCENGNTGKLGMWRKIVSIVATRISQIIMKIDTSDPMSGFFMITKESFLKVVGSLNASGYKILLDIASQFNKGELKTADIPYTFKNRIHGDSKLSPKVVMELIDFIYLKSVGDFIPIDYVKFISVGIIGAVFHFATLYLMYVLLGNSYAVSLILAIELSLIINYFINNLWTFREKMHNGFAIFLGLIKFNMLSGIGGIMSYYISLTIFEANVNWVVASLIGAVVASLWNYNLNRILTWRAI